MAFKANYGLMQVKSTTVLLIIIKLSYGIKIFVVVFLSFFLFFFGGGGGGVSGSLTQVLLYVEKYRTI